MRKPTIIVLSLALIIWGCGGGGESGAGGTAGASGTGGVGGTGGTGGTGGVGGTGGTGGRGGVGGTGGTGGAGGGTGGTAGSAGGGGGGGAGGTAGSAGMGGTGGMPENRCPFFTSVLVSPLTQSVGNLVDVDTRVLDFDGDDVEVLVTSSCGEIADPLQTANAQTGESSTTVRCDRAGLCTVTVRASDDGFDPEGCSGTTGDATSTIPVDCQ